MADKTFVEDFVDFGAIVNGALWLADDERTLGRCGGIGHGGHRNDTKRGVDSRRSRQ